MIKTNYVSLKKAFLVFILLTAFAAVASYYYAVEQHYLEQQNIHLNKMVKYHTKMIKTGSISSLVKLGQMYEKGEGVEKNLSKAQELFKKAINYNKYLDEIYPSYSDDNSNGKNRGKINNNDLTEDHKKENQLKNIEFSVKSIEKSNKQPKITPPQNITFKKTIVIKKNSNAIKFKKTRLHAKRSLNLNEERTDYENNLDVINNETLIDNINAKILSIKKNAEKKNAKKNISEKKQSSKSSFASNPCDTESAQYIAKCRRLKK